MLKISKRISGKHTLSYAREKVDNCFKVAVIYETLSIISNLCLIFCYVVKLELWWHYNCPLNQKMWKWPSGFWENENKNSNISHIRLALIEIRPISKRLDTKLPFVRVVQFISNEELSSSINSSYRDERKSEKNIEYQLKKII